MRFLFQLPVSALIGGALLAGCASPYHTVQEHPINPNDYDPFKRYALGGQYECGAEQPQDERLNMMTEASGGFGCSHQHNIGAMVANRNHLHRPVAMTPPDEVRRAGVLDLYRQGRDTATSAQAQGADALINNVE